MDLQALTSRFKLPGLRFEAGSGGLTCAVIHTPAVRGMVYLHGAHVIAYEPAGQAPVLWMSDHSLFAANQPIRGGVPICFPWFGPHPTDATAPGHGLARLRDWDLIDAVSLADDGIALVLSTEVDPFVLRYRVQMGRMLELKLSVTLSESASTSFTFEEALHTYFSVSDIRRISISGLESTGYLDKVGGMTTRSATGEPVRFAGETDRVYSNTTSACILRDPILQRAITVSKSGSNTTVVWNPWIDKSARMPDFGDGEWPGMVCIETANAGENAITLAPGASHEMTAKIEVGQ